MWWQLIKFKLVVRLWMYQNQKHRKTLELLEILVNEIEQTETTLIVLQTEG